MADRGDILDFLDDLLDARGWPDYGPNGLQVPGAEDVELVVTGVSAHQELFRRAAAEGAQLLLCHHGMMWESQPRRVTAQAKERLRLLFEADISLAAYHLPLDAHPEHGNNALLCELLGLERAEPFGEARGMPLGFVGRSRDGVPAGGLFRRVRDGLGRDPLVFDAGPDTVHALAVVTGAGAGELGRAIELGLDGLVTGEPAEHSMADAREGGVHFIAAGHYATETLGIRRLGELVAERFGVEHRFIEVANPV